MNQLFKSVVFSLCFITCFLSFAAITIEDEIKTSPNSTKLTIGLIVFPPYILQADNNECYGDAVDKLTAIFEPYNYDITFYCSSPSRIYRDFNSGYIDISINVKSTSAIEGNALYSEQPYEILRVSVFKKNTTKTSNVKSLSSIRKYNYHGMRNKLDKEGYRFIDSNNTREAIAVFMREQEIGLISYADPFYYYLEKVNNMRNLGNLKENISERVLIEAPTFYIINKQREDAATLKQIIDRF